MSFLDDVKKRAEDVLEKSGDLADDIGGALGSKEVADSARKVKSGKASAKDYAIIASTIVPGGTAVKGGGAIVRSGTKALSRRKGTKRLSEVVNDNVRQGSPGRIRLSKGPVYPKSKGKRKDWGERYNKGTRYDNALKISNSVRTRPKTPKTINNRPSIPKVEKSSRVRVPRPVRNKVDNFKNANKRGKALRTAGYAAALGLPAYGLASGLLSGDDDESNKKNNKGKNKPQLSIDDIKSQYKKPERLNLVNPEDIARQMLEAEEGNSPQLQRRAGRLARMEFNPQIRAQNRALAMSQAQGQLATEDAAGFYQQAQDNARRENKLLNKQTRALLRETGKGQAAIARAPGGGGGRAVLNDSASYGLSGANELANLNNQLSGNINKALAAEGAFAANNVRNQFAAEQQEMRAGLTDLARQRALARKENLFELRDRKTSSNQQAIQNSLGALEIQQSVNSKGSGFARDKARYQAAEDRLYDLASKGTLDPEAARIDFINQVPKKFIPLARQNYKNTIRPTVKRLYKQSQLGE